MHIEKNVCDSIIGTLLNIPWKTKNSLASRLDLVEIEVRPELAPQFSEKWTYLLATCYNLKKRGEESNILDFSKIKVSYGYSSHILNLVSIKDLKLNGLKSPDCHVLMQQLLHVALGKLIKKPIRFAITKLCLFLNEICVKTVDIS